MDYRALIRKAEKDNLVGFLTAEMETLEKTDPDMVGDLYRKLFRIVYGPHFSEDLYNDAVKCLRNADGTTGPKWTEAQITEYATDRGIQFGKNYNRFDFAYAMNMIYSDYFGVIPDETENYFRLAKAFIEDRDAPEGKAWKYYVAMTE